MTSMWKKKIHSKVYTRRRRNNSLQYNIKSVISFDLIIVFTCSSCTSFYSKSFRKFKLKSYFFEILVSWTTLAHVVSPRILTFCKVYGSGRTLTAYEDVVKRLSTILTHVFYVFTFAISYILIFKKVKKVFFFCFLYSPPLSFSIYWHWLFLIEKNNPNIIYKKLMFNIIID